MARATADKFVKQAKQNVQQVEKLTKELDKLDKQSEDLVQRQKEVISQLEMLTGSAAGTFKPGKTGRRGRKPGSKQVEGGKRGPGLRNLLLSEVVPASGEDAIKKQEMVGPAEKQGWTTSATDEKQKITLIGQALNALKTDGLVENPSRGAWRRTKKGDKAVAEAIAEEKKENNGKK